jgi:signal transduction histidine kinase
MEFEQQSFVTLANSFSEMSLFSDPSFTVLQAYGPVSRFTGREASELEGQELFSLFAPDSSKLLLTLINPLKARVHRDAPDESVKLDDDSLHLKNLTLISGAGEMLVEVRIVPRRDTGVGSGAYYYMVIVNDLSYTKDLDKKKNSFFATLNHELRTPLNGIIGLTESLRSAEKEKARKKQFDMMLNSAQCMLKLVNNILDVAAMRNNAADLELSQVKMNNLVEEVVELMNSAVDKRGRKLRKEAVEIRVNLGEDVPTIDMDKEKIFQVLEAIVNNSLKFTQKGEVTIKTMQDETTHSVIVTVEDTGIGIAKDAIERIFESFEQEDDDHENRKFEGLGLGLTLAKDFVNLHGGKLWVESEVGKGSTFFISVPPNVRALKLISEKQRLSQTSGVHEGDNASTNNGGALSQEERDRMELIRVRQAEQIDVMQREVFSAMKAISHLTIDLELFEEKCKGITLDPRSSKRLSGGSAASGSQLSVASHFLSNKLRSYEMPTANGVTSSPTSRLHRNFGVGTNFAYNNY